LFASTLNTDLDSQTIYAQQVAETAERGLKAPVIDPTDINMTLPAKATRAGTVLAFNATTGNPEAGPSIGSVTTVAAQSANINTVATNIASVNTVAGNNTNINTVAGISGNVTTVAGISANVTSVAGNSSNINTVAGISGNVTTVAGVSSSVSTVAGISANVTTVAGISSNVTTVAGVSANVTTVATNIAAVNTNATNIVAIQNASTNATNAATSATNAANSATAAAASAASAAASFDAFDDIYLGAKSSNPTVDNDGDPLSTGDQYFNTVSNELRVWNGSSWQAASVIGGTVTSLDVTGVASFSDGTVSLPSITNIGDTNTGIFFPAADTIAFTEGGVESMRINSSGNLLVGTDTNPSESQARQVLATSSSAYLQFARTATTVGGALIGTGGQNFIVQTYTGAIGSETYTERMRIDSSGNVGIGLTAPTRLLHIDGGSSTTYFQMTNTASGRTNADGFQIAQDGANAELINREAGYLNFATSNTERMRISSTGTVAIGTTTTPTAKLWVESGRVGLTNAYKLGWHSNPAHGDLNNYITGDDGSNYVALGTSAAERMRIDSSGNLLIGTTSTSTVISGKAVNLSGSGNVGYRCYGGGTSVGHFYNTSGDTTIIGSCENSGAVLAFHTGASAGSERMRIDSSGNLGVGTSSPNTRIQSTVGSNGSGVVVGLRLQNVGTTAGDGAKILFTAGTSTNGAGISSTGVALDSADLRFETGGSNERMRILSGGALCVGTTSATGSVRFIVESDTTTLNPMTVSNTRSTAATDYSIIFYRNGSIVGSVQTSLSATSYVTSSDYRLKENIAPMTGALAKVELLKPVTYDWKTGGSSQGFIAHELAEVCPDAVTGEKDAVDEDGNIKPQGIDTSFLVATLTAAIQELNAKVEAQAVRIAELESK
jgi:hypothetical protein